MKNSENLAYVLLVAYLVITSICGYFSVINTQDCLTRITILENEFEKHEETHNGT